MKRLGQRFRGASSSGIAVATALLALGSLGGCGDKESLIVVTASTSDSYVTGLHTLVVTADKTQKTFPIGQDVTNGFITVGLYVPSSVTGPAVKVTVQAVGDQCGPGYSGSTKSQSERTRHQRRPKRELLMPHPCTSRQHPRSSG